MPTITPFSSDLTIPHLQRLRLSKPLVHCITNDVVQNFTANVLLAIGAIPAMVIAKEEVVDFVTVADGLLINLGTINHLSAESMLLAAKAANETSTPWVLDPVAVSPALSYRTTVAKQLLDYNPLVIRGNAAEILTLADLPSQSKGPDSQSDSVAAIYVAQQLAQQYHNIILVTGKTDYVTDGNIIYSINGGDTALTKVTGTGCSLSAMVAAFVASTDSPIIAACCASQMMKMSANRAYTAAGLGTFGMSLIDQLSLFDPTQYQG